MQESNLGMTGMTKLSIFIPLLVLTIYSVHRAVKSPSKDTKGPISTQRLPKDTLQFILHTRLGVGLDALPSQLLEFGDQTQKESRLKDGVSLL